MSGTIKPTLTLLTALLLAPLAALAFGGTNGKEKPAPAKATATSSPAFVAAAAQLAWQDLNFGVMFHFDPRVCNHGRQNAASKTPRKDAAVYAAKFNPGKIDTDQWIAAAKALGANHAILFVKHEAGFCLWQLDANPYSLKSITRRDGKADILKDFVAFCKKYGLKSGVFAENRFDGLGATVRTAL